MGGGGGGCLVIDGVPHTCLLCALNMRHLFAPHPTVTGNNKVSDFVINNLFIKHLN